MEVGKSSPIVIGSIYYEKWEKMSHSELKKELELIESRINICVNRNIMNQLLEIKQMLESYIKTNYKIGIEDV